MIALECAVECVPIPLLRCVLNLIVVFSYTSSHLIFWPRIHQISPVSLILEYHPLIYHDVIEQILSTLLWLRCKLWRRSSVEVPSVSMHALLPVIRSSILSPSSSHSRIAIGWAMSRWLLPLFLLWFLPGKDLNLCALIILILTVSYTTANLTIGAGVNEDCVWVNGKDCGLMSSCPGPKRWRVVFLCYSPTRKLPSDLDHATMAIFEIYTLIDRRGQILPA